LGEIVFSLHVILNRVRARLIQRRLILSDLFVRLGKLGFQFGVQALKRLVGACELSLGHLDVLFRGLNVVLAGKLLGEEGLLTRVFALRRVEVRLSLLLSGEGRCALDRVGAMDQPVPLFNRLIECGLGLNDGLAGQGRLGICCNRSCAC